MPRKSEPNPPPSPTEAEFAILEVLWAHGPQTVREVFDRLAGRGTGYTTVLKQLQVMTAKGLAIRNERYRSHVYQARQPEKATQQQLLRDFMRRAFAGSAKKLVLGALSAEPISAAELAEIRRALAAYEEKALEEDQ